MVVCELYSQTKINNFDNFVISQENVRKFQISMHYSAVLHVLNTDSKLANIICHFLFIQKASFWHLLDTLKSSVSFSLLLFYIRVKLATFAVLHKQIDVLFIFKKMEESSNILAV